jgi:hypothetical protein
MPGRLVVKGKRGADLLPKARAAAARLKDLFALRRIFERQAAEATRRHRQRLRADADATQEHLQLTMAEERAAEAAPLADADLRTLRAYLLAHTRVAEQRFWRVLSAAEQLELCSYLTYRRLAPPRPGARHGDPRRPADPPDTLRPLRATRPSAGVLVFGRAWAQQRAHAVHRRGAAVLVHRDHWAEKGRREAAARRGAARDIGSAAAVPSAVAAAAVRGASSSHSSSVIPMAAVAAVRGAPTPTGGAASGAGGDGGDDGGDGGGGAGGGSCFVNGDYVRARVICAEQLQGGALRYALRFEGRALSERVDERHVRPLLALDDDDGGGGGGGSGAEGAGGTAAAAAAAAAGSHAFCAADGVVLEAGEVFGALQLPPAFLPHPEDREAETAAEAAAVAGGGRGGVGGGGGADADADADADAGTADSAAASTGEPQREQNFIPPPIWETVRVEAPCEWFELKSTCVEL